MQKRKLLFAFASSASLIFLPFYMEPFLPLGSQWWLVAIALCWVPWALTYRNEIRDWAALRTKRWT